MTDIISLQGKIDQLISKNKYLREPKELYEPINYFISLGGKRMRPALVLMGCEAFGGAIDDAIDAAIAIEIFHNFTLLHDDIMDNAPLRRGSQTVHEKWNTNIAILSGDVMLVEAYQSLAKVKAGTLPLVLSIFNDTAVKVCEGQQIDMNFESRTDVTIAEYIGMIEMKTAVLLAGSLKIGALLGGARGTDADHLYEFGKNMGIAFQLQDDLLDVFGNPEKFGKQVGGDIVSNKKTFLMLKALELAKGENREELKAWIGKKQFNPTEKINRIKEIYTKLDIEQLTSWAMDDYSRIALAHLDKVAVSEEGKLLLRKFAKKILVRES